MRIAFWGTPEIAVPSLEALASRHDICALICRPDRPKGRGRKVSPPPTKIWALSHGIPVYQPEKLNDGVFIEIFREIAPDLCAVVAYGRILKQPYLDVPPEGFLNMHPSLLPRYRGPSPIQTAILNGDTETGVTIMRMTLEMDAGDILLQETESIYPEDTTGTLSVRLAEKGARLFVDAVERIERGEAVFIPQDPDKVVMCHLFEKQDGRIQWGNTAVQIHNLVRAANPWPMAFTSCKNTIFRIIRSEPVEDDSRETPGVITRIEKDRILVSTGKGLLAILEIQIPGKRIMPVADFLRGHPLQAGICFI